MSVMRVAVGSLAFLAALPAAAQAPSVPQPSTAPSEPPTITRTEVEEMMRGLFAQIDVNHDGILDAAEQKALLDNLTGNGAPPPAVDAVRRMFTEGTGADGKITLDTFVKARMASFDKADTNHDGKLDPAEQKAARAAEGMPD